MSFISKAATNKIDSKINQVVHSITMEIEKGDLKRGHKLPSINNFSKHFDLSRDTIEKAYRRLVRGGQVKSVPGSGYYVLNRRTSRPKVLLIISSLNMNNNILVDSFLQTFSQRARVDISFFHDDMKILSDIIIESLENYNYYVLVSYGISHVKLKSQTSLLQMIPTNQFFLLGEEVPNLSHQRMGVYFQIKEELYQVLNKMHDWLRKYNTIKVVLNEHNVNAGEINYAVSKFCLEHNKELIVAHDIGKTLSKTPTIFIMINELDLVKLLKRVKTKGLVLGKDLGILCINENATCQQNQVTVLSSDFKRMGQAAAELILENKFIKNSNLFKIIHRASL